METFFLNGHSKSSQYLWRGGSLMEKKELTNFARKSPNPKKI